MKVLPTSLVSNGFRISGFYLIALFLNFSTSSTAQGVTIGSNTPADPSATLEVKSTTGGVLLPRLSTAQRNGISNPAAGLMIYNTSTECMEVYHSSGWKAFSCACSSPPPAPSSIQGPNQVCAQQTAVSFYVSAVPGATQYTWTATGGASIQSGQGDTLVSIDFGSGSGSISVEASNFCGIAPLVSTNYLAANPDPTFSVNPAQPITNQAAVFSASSTGLQYAWTFQNGSPATSTSANPSVTYSSTGVNSVKLVVTDLNGCTDSSTQSITVTNCPAPGQNQVAFNYTGGQQSWTVPATCVSSVTLECWGAQGGSSISTGGAGGYAKGDLAVTPGQVLYLYVGGQGGNPGGGWNGGGSGQTSGSPASGGGGGASDVRVGGQSLSDRVIVAGGGGGSCTLYSGNFSSTSPGQGGGNSGTSAGNVFNGNATATGGAGGNQNSGGNGGVGNQTGSAGTLGQGGAGFPGGDSTGGGGGAGYYGGGGGGYQSSGTNIASSGGGGSGYTGTLSNASMQTGIRNGNGQIVITY
jgi:PKD repeat protein